MPFQELPGVKHHIAALFCREHIFFFILQAWIWLVFHWQEEILWKCFGEFLWKCFGQFLWCCSSLGSCGAGMGTECSSESKCEMPGWHWAPWAELTHSSTFPTRRAAAGWTKQDLNLFYLGILPELHKLCLNEDSVEIQILIRMVIKKKTKNIQNKGLIFWKNSKMTKLCVRILFFIYLPPSTTWNGLAFYFPPSGTWTQPFHSYVIYCYTFSQKWKLEINHWQEHTPTCNQSAESKINLYSSILINILHIWINIANKFAHSFSKLTDD